MTSAWERPASRPRGDTTSFHSRGRTYLLHCTDGQECQCGQWGPMTNGTALLRACSGVGGRVERSESRYARISPLWKRQKMKKINKNILRFFKKLLVRKICVWKIKVLITVFREQILNRFKSCEHGSFVV